MYCPPAGRHNLNFGYYAPRHTLHRIKIIPPVRRTRYLKHSFIAIRSDAPKRGVKRDVTASIIRLSSATTQWSEKKNLQQASKEHQLRQRKRSALFKIPNQCSVVKTNLNASIQSSHRVDERE